MVDQYPAICFKTEFNTSPLRKDNLRQIGTIKSGIDFSQSIACLPRSLQIPPVINDDERIPAADRAARNSFGLHLLCEYDVHSPHRAARIAVPFVQGIRRFGVFRSLPDDDEKPVTVQF